jgi:uncharacterized protein YdaU (DUF1376 family)
MSKTPFMPLQVADFIADTVDLDATATGAYILLLMAQWKRKGASLPMDHKRLKRITKVGRNWPKVWDQIKDHFEEDFEGVYNPKCREVVHEVNMKVQANKRNGARGGRAKALKYNKSALANAKNSPKRDPTILELELDNKIKNKSSSENDEEDHPDYANMSTEEFLKVTGFK